MRFYTEFVGVIVAVFGFGLIGVATVASGLALVPIDGAIAGVIVGASVMFSGMATVIASRLCGR